MKKAFPFLLAMLAAIPSWSQEVEMADTMRSNGKIYVVVSILVVILAGIIVYLVMIDRKVNRMEKKLDESNKT